LERTERQRQLQKATCVLCTYRELISSIRGAGVEDEELVVASQLDRMPRAGDIRGQVDVSNEQADIVEEAQLSTHEARDQQVPVRRDGDAARLVADRPLRRLTVPVQLQSATQRHFRCRT